MLLKTYQQRGKSYHGKQRQEARMITSGEIFYPCTGCGFIQKCDFAIYLLSYSAGNGSERSLLIFTDRAWAGKLHSPEKIDSQLGWWPEFASLGFPFFKPNNTIRNYLADCFQSLRPASYKESHRDSKTVNRGKRAIRFQTTTCCKVRDRKAFLEHSFILVGPQDYFALVPNFQSCNPNANAFIPLLHLTLSLDWNEHPCIT